MRRRQGVHRRSLANFCFDFCFGFCFGFGFGFGCNFGFGFGCGGGCGLGLVQHPQLVRGGIALAQSPKGCCFAVVVVVAHACSCSYSCQNKPNPNQNQNQNTVVAVGVAAESAAGIGSGADAETVAAVVEKLEAASENGEVQLYPTTRLLPLLELLWWSTVHHLRLGWCVQTAPNGNPIP